MDKYTVDIDKVLDAFEESEALQAAQPFKIETAPLQEPRTFLDFSNPDEALPQQQSYSKEPLTKSNVKSNLIQNPPLKNYDFPESSENSTKKFSLSEADFSPTAQTENMQSFQNSHAWNYEIYYKSFQPFSETSKESKSTSSNSSFKPISPTALGVKDNQPHEQNVLLNSEKKYNLEEEVLCVSVERTDSVQDTQNVSPLKTISAPCGSKKFSEIESNNSETVDNEVITQSVHGRTYNDTLSSVSKLKSDKFKACSLENSSLLLSPFDTSAKNCTEENSIDFSLRCEDNEEKAISTANFPSLHNGSFYSEQIDAVQSQSTVSFSELVEPSLSMEEMNEYLAELTIADPVQDEDSGVSSQEDVNGNNLSIDTDNRENVFTETVVPPDPDDRWCKMYSVDKKVQKNNNEPSHSRANEHKDDHISPECESVDLNESCSTVIKHIELNVEMKHHLEHEGMDIVNDKGAAECEIAISTGAIPKRDLAGSPSHSTENLSSSLSVSTDCQNTLYDSSNSPNDLIDTDVTVSGRRTQDDFVHAVNSDSELNSLPIQNKEYEIDMEHTLKNNEFLSKIQSLPVETKDISNGISTSNFIKTTIDSDVQKQLNELLPENESMSSLENSSHSPKLQRPTTLNLPFRNNTSPMVNNSIGSNVTPPAVYDSGDIPSEEAVEETLLEDLEDQNIAEGDSKALPESQNVNHVPEIGSIKPFWIPDSEAANCMHCNIKFTVIKRRHHCRACGKVLCSSCCNQKARLHYLPNKENRVCQQCYEVLCASQTERSAGQHGESPASSSCGSSPSFSPAPVNSNFPQKGYWRPHPNNPDDYCSTISPLQQVQHLANRPPPTVMVPVGVLKRGAKPRGEPKQVIFSDGIRPGGDLTDLTEPVELAPAYRRPGRRRIDKSGVDNDASYSSVSATSVPVMHTKSSRPRSRHKRIVISDLEGPLPPILFSHDHMSDVKLDLILLMEKLKDDQLEPIVFAITKNLHILTKITTLDCYFGKECWCFTSHGLCTVGQDEVLFILERFADEDVIPRDAFRLFSKLYDNACKGSTVSELGHVIFQDNIFGNWEHRGFLFVRPTFQILNQLVLPSTPFLVAILIQKWEVPWAKVFPLRLMLRLGEECRHYPCSLVSVRFRKPVYYKIGETIMSVLADLRNYQFTIPFVPGLVVHIEEKKTCVNIPRNRYEKLMKVLNSNNVEHVLALGANFSTEADSHLVCMQTENGDYSTQAMNIKNTTRKVTGASFIVFSGALKSSTGFSAKFSIVEDGLLIQIPQETMDLLHSALREMHDLTINCGPINSPDPEVVIIQWTKDDKKFNMGVRSPVDGRNLEGVPSLRIHASTDYASENYLIRWTEVFFLDVDENANNKRIDAIDPCRLAETVAQACCMALIPYLDPLSDAQMTRIGLRVTLDTERDKVEYDVGSQGQPLPSMYMNALDSSLIPVISRITGATQDEPVALELIFHILIK